MFYRGASRSVPHGASRCALTHWRIRQTTAGGCCTANVAANLLRDVSGGMVAGKTGAARWQHLRKSRL